MIKIFRAIRQRLLSENKFSRYFIYALGEIILVVIGILIALSINNWNQEIKTKEREQFLLQQFKEDYEADLIQIDEKIEIRNNLIHSSNWLLDFIDQPNKIESDSILYHIGFTNWTATFDPININLNTSRELSIISDPKLRRLLSNWDSDVQQVLELEEDWSIFVENLRTPFDVEHNILRDLSVENQKRYMRRLEDEGFDVPTRIFSKSKTDVDYIAFVMQPEFESMLAHGRVLNSIINAQSEGLKMKMNEILSLINSNLTNKQN